MNLILTVILMTLTTAVTAVAASGVPEIDPVSGTSAIAMLIGAILVLRGRRKP